MKKSILAALALIASTTSAFAQESGCRTDGCVFLKNAEYKAVLLWLESNDDCMNAVSWLQSVKKLDNTRYQAVCGDTSDQDKIRLEVSNPDFSLDPAAIGVKRIK
jgi:hypothetical protein